MAKTRIHLTPAEAEAKGWRCRTHLKADRLMPGADARPTGSVWQGQRAYDVYDPADCVPWRWTPGPAQQRRQVVAAQAQELLGGGRIAVVDTETTGVSDDDEVCEIAILDVSGVPILNTLVRPTRPIPAEATAIHGITNEMVATAPSWLEVADQYAAAVAGRTAVAYNSAFDKRLLWQTHQRHGLTAPAVTAACAMLMYAVWNGEWDEARGSWRWRKLIDAATDCGVAENGAHRALADARMTLGVLRYLQQRTSGRKTKVKRV